MAIDLCSESPSLGTSPRISFSYDVVSNENNYPLRSDSSLLHDSTSDFNFCIGTEETEPSTADELFSGGLIRPLQIQQRFVKSNTKSIPSPTPPLPISTQNKSDSVSKSKQFSETEQRTLSKSFWKIKRSSSLHCDNSYKKSSFWSLPTLLRSNSTGSAPNSKLNPKNSQKQQKNLSGFSSSSSSATFNGYSFSQKPPLKKSYGGGYYGNGVRISPVLNVPTSQFFGLGSLFRNGKDKKNKK